MTCDAYSGTAVFIRLYADASVYASFSKSHPISLHRVLLFTSSDSVMCDVDVLTAEEAYLSDKGVNIQQRIIDGYVKCGLLTESDATNVLSVIDWYDA